ncbi:hypothetical protein H2248_012180 [Termitomyces sp. 'cryptogamus']|nr:hypothetical protein H2248_012180 [Termitomyces sp. 'cryptogamus']
MDLILARSNRTRKSLQSISKERAHPVRETLTCHSPTVSSKAAMGIDRTLHTWSSGADSLEITISLKMTLILALIDISDVV